MNLRFINIEIIGWENWMPGIHREGLMFKWSSKNYEIVIGFKRVEHNNCSNCGKRIPTGNTICNECFEKEKEISKK